jgi:uncharacterized membrane protein YjgN (DUF898 family)
MKNYFDFTLTGKKLFPVWIFFYVLVIIPYSVYSYQTTLNSHAGKANPLTSLGLLLIVMVGYLLVFFIIKMIMEAVKYKEHTLQFEGQFLSYVGKILLGIVLSAVTLGIYLAWFIKDLTKFFCNNTTLNEERFQFKGKAGRLFVILLLTMLLPIILFTTASIIYFYPTNQNVVGMALLEGFLIIGLIPYYYFCYKWMVDIQYKGYGIKWETTFFESFLKILTEVLLSIITLGIYLPMAYLRLFSYFSARTVAVSEESTLQFGFEYHAKNDFFFIWGQALLTIITLGIYYPWGISKIGKRFLAQTYVLNVNAE